MTDDALTDKLSRRVAHATYALLVASKEHAMPVTASETVIYDEEARDARATGAALRESQRLGLAVYTGRYWVPTNLAHSLRRSLEDRYCAETEELHA